MCIYCTYRNTMADSNYWRPV